MSKTNFEAIATDAQGLGRFLRSFRLSKRRGIWSFKSDIVAGAGRRIATLAGMSASGIIPNGGYPLEAGQRVAM